MIQIEQISYWYPDCKDAALRNLSLQVARGEAIAVMGRNGSGKSTLIKLISGLIKPARGRTALDGRAVDGPPGPRRVGVLFQNPDNQMVAAQVEKEIAFALENLGMPLTDMQSAVHRVAEQFGIDHILGRLTTELSGGEKQRVALASVMVLKPQVLLLDEPDAFLDRAGREILDNELRNIRVTAPELVEIRVTQSAEVAARYPRLILFENGGVVADGRPAEILANRELCVRTGIGLPPAQDLEIEAVGLDRTGRPHRLDAILCEEIGFAWPSAEPVFSHLNASLRRGETIGLVGPTGSGKSSLALLLCGLLSPTGGAIHYLDSGKGPLKSGEYRGDLALVLQQPERQFFLETCSEEVAFGPSNLGSSLRPGEIGRLLNAVGLPPSRFSDRDPFTLSAGEKRRLAFASVISMSPSIIVFDEPTAGLDGDGVGRFMALSRRLKEAGVGQLLISHDVELIARLTDRVLCLNERRTLVELPPVAKTVD
jgi:energy-coupling factor transport system ATP-binding protein